MSGGSYDYAYYKIEELADSIRDDDNPKRAAFKKLLKLAAKAAHDIEWVDSGDCAPGDENAAIDACFKAVDGGIKALAYDDLIEWMEKVVDGSRRPAPQPPAGGEK